MRLRLLAAPAIAGALVLAQAVGISPASASVTDLACNYTVGSFNACLNFTPAQDNTDDLIAHVGLDLYTQFGSQYGAFQAALYADVNGPDLFIGYLNLSPGWPAADSQGVGVELTRGFGRAYNLNVNLGGDESFYAVIFYDDPFGNRLSKRTGTVHGEFAPSTGGNDGGGGGGGGGGGCFADCP